MSLIAPYDPAWESDGVAIAASLQSVLVPLALRIEHIGSTAIPGMAAKPVFDLQVSVADLFSAASSFDAPLVELGFERLPWENDHVPAGRDDPVALWSKRIWVRRPGALPAVNLHCRLVGSPNERLALLFRDWFRAHPAAVPAYARFKQLLSAAVADDLRAYTEVKDPVVDLVVMMAEQWAAATNWHPEAHRP